MTSNHEPLRRSDPSLKPLMRNLAIELVIYTPLVAIYYVVVFQYAKEPLFRLYLEQPVLYAFAAILVLFIQGVLLHTLTSWLIRRIGLR